MKNWIKKAVPMVLLLTAGPVGSFAQENKSVDMDVKFDRPEKIPLHLSVFGYYNGEFLGGGHAYLGASGAVLISKYFLAQANVGLIPKSLVDFNVNGYSNLKQTFVADGRFTFRFKDEVKENKETKTWKSGMYQYTLNFTRKERSTHGAHIVGHMSTINIMQQTGKDSIFQIQENGADVSFRDLTASQTMIAIGGGYNFLTITNYKGRVKEVGKTIRSRNFTNFYIEAMYAPVIRISEEVLYTDPQTNTMHRYTIANQDKVRLGFRMVAEVNKGRPGWYFRTELGRKTGLKIPHEKKWLTNAFLGVGFGIGW